jgi:hypothetical protein
MFGGRWPESPQGLGSAAIALSMKEWLAHNENPETSPQLDSHSSKSSQLAQAKVRASKPKRLG